MKKYKFQLSRFSHGCVQHFTITTSVENAQSEMTLSKSQALVIGDDYYRQLKSLMENPTDESDPGFKSWRLEICRVAVSSLIIYFYQN